MSRGRPPTADDLLREVEGAAECHPEDYESRSLSDMFKIAVSRMLMFFN